MKDRSLATKWEIVLKQMSFWTKGGSEFLLCIMQKAVTASNAQWCNRCNITMAFRKQDPGRGEGLGGGKKNHKDGEKKRLSPSPCVLVMRPALGH